MRIAMVSEHASPLAAIGGVDAGGQNVYVGALSRALAARGHEIDVYTRRDEPARPTRRELAPGVTVVHVPAGPPEPLPKDELLPWMPAFGRWMARDWLETSPPVDVVHNHFWMSGLAAATACAQLRIRTGQAVPSVQTFHALGRVKRRWQGRQDTSPPERLAAEAQLAAGADAVIATCRDELHELEEMGARVSSTHVVPCGVDLDHFRPFGPATLPGHQPDRLDAVPRGQRLLSVGRLVERKGIDTVLRALPGLPDAHLVVAGGPPAEALGRDPEARRLQGLAADLGVGDRVHLLGQVDPALLPSLYRWSDVVVAAPWYEPFGMVALEAMACGRPVLASAVGGLLDTVVPGRTGVLVPPQDPVHLATAARDLLGDPDRRDALGQAGRARAVTTYGWDRVAEGVEGAYLSVAAPSPLLSREAM